ncbi:DNRLRE domain-containing protein, partial [Planctomycetota bacterium]
FLISLHSKSARSVEHAYAAFKLAQQKDKTFGDDLKERMVKYVVASGGADKGSTMAMVNNNPHDFFAARQKALAIIAGQEGLAAGLDFKGPLKGVKAQTDVFHYCVACGEACGPVKCEWCGAAQKGAEAPGDASSLILQQGVDGYAGCRDTYADVDKPDHDRDDRLVLESDGKSAKLKAVALEFAIPANKVSPAAKIHKAMLTLYCMRQSSSSGQITVHMLKDKWNIPLKYHDADTLAGKELMKLGISNFRTAQGNDINPPVPVTFDITHAVKNWVPDKHINYGVILLPSRKEYADLRFVPSEDERAKYRPKLEISYTN